LRGTIKKKMHDAMKVIARSTKHIEKGS